MLIGLGFTGWMAEAAACGGFFCDNATPVDQSGETVVFGVENGIVSTHARIDYEGPAENFAWVLPASGIPEIFLSNEQLFAMLDAVTTPQLRVDQQFAEGCAPDVDADTDADSDGDTDADIDTSGDPFVSVLSTQEVGPYEAVVVDASSPEALVGWLQDNGYGVPTNFTAAAAPYLASGMNFLALKLQKGISAGSLPPLGVRWEGDRPSIPLTLTQVAAVPDLPLTVYVLGQQRAVPLSYLHVQLNPLVFDWFGWSPDWASRIGLAADEAGGRAFATLFAGNTPTNSICNYVTSGLAKSSTALEWFLALPSAGFGSGESQILNILRVHVPAPGGVDEVDFYNNPYAYSGDWAALDASFDPITATADLEAQIVAPCAEAERMLGANPYLTRMMSLISPEEMTVDPVFGFNADLPEVPREREATLYFDCHTELRTLTLPGDHVLQITEAESDGRPTAEWVAGRLEHNALVIEQLSEEGEGDILADYRAEFGDVIVLPDPSDPDVLEDPEDKTPSAACGCSSGGVGAVLPFVTLGLLVRGMRRREAGRSQRGSSASSTGSKSS